MKVELTGRNVSHLLTAGLTAVYARSCPPAHVNDLITALCVLSVQAGVPNDKFERLLAAAKAGEMPDDLDGLGIEDDEPEATGWDSYTPGKKGPTSL
jgi:hypothetical protein